MAETASWANKGSVAREVLITIEDWDKAHPEDAKNCPPDPITPSDDEARGRGGVGLPVTSTGWNPLLRKAAAVQWQKPGSKPPPSWRRNPDQDVVECFVALPGLSLSRPGIPTGKDCPPAHPDPEVGRTPPAPLLLPTSWPSCRDPFSWLRLWDPWRPGRTRCRGLQDGFWDRFLRRLLFPVALLRGFPRKMVPTGTSSCWAPHFAPRLGLLDWETVCRRASMFSSGRRRRRP